jgi:AcrR family transcriptional regulator
VARTPSAEAHEKVLEAAVRLISKLGIDQTSMDAIAQLSGVSKATIYKHWKDKDDLVLDVLRHLSTPVPEYDTGDPRKDLASLLRFFVTAQKSERLLKIWPRIIGYAVSSPKFGTALQRFAFGPRREQISRLLEELKRRGQLQPGIDAELAADLLIGPIMHRRMMTGDSPADLAERVLDSFWRAWGK